MLEDAGEPTDTDPFRDASHGGTGGTGQGTELDAATPTDGDAGELGDAAATPEGDAG